MFGSSDDNKIWVHPTKHLELEFELSERYYPHSSADIAILDCTYLLENHQIAIAPFSQNKILDWGASSIGLGHPVMFVGYPRGQMDVRHNFPIVRTATIASLPEVDVNGEPAFLIDGTVLRGSSGSPVFIAGELGNVNNNFSCVGIIHGFRTANTKIKNLSDLDSRMISFEENIGIGLATKSSALLSLLDETYHKILSGAPYP